MAINPIQIPSFDPIAKVIKSGAAFTNPYAVHIDKMKDQVAQMLIDLPNIVDPEITPHVTQITSAITTLDTALDDLLDHTDKLSGVSLTGGLNSMNFSTISSVVSTVQKYGNDGSACELINGAFGAIVKAAEFVNDMNVLYGRLVNLSLAPDTLPFAIDTLKNKILSQIQADLLTFANAQITALQYAAAAALTELTNNPCISEIIAIVGTDELKKATNEAIQNL